MSSPGATPWAAGTATGVGSLPGTDALAAARAAVDLCPALPFLPELPERGVGADLVGRGTGLLAELPVDLQPAGWRLVPRAGHDLRRTLDLLERDLDAVQDALDGYRGPFKVQACGPWTLAALVELPRGDKVLADPGAVRDLAAALGEGLARQVADLRRRLPGLTDVLVQLDEPGLAAVAAGHVPTASGFDVLRTPEAVELAAVLHAVSDAVRAAGGVPGAHCCAARPPVATLVAGGAGFVGVDVTVLTPRDDDELGEALEAGTALLAGLVPTSVEPADVGVTMQPLQALWSRLGLPTDRLGAVAVTPTCGLAGASPDAAAQALRRSRETAEELVQQ